MDFTSAKAVLSCIAEECPLSNYERLLIFVKHVLRSPEANFNYDSFLLFSGNHKLNYNKIPSCQQDIVRERGEYYFRNILNTIQFKTCSLNYTLSDILAEFHTAANCGIELSEPDAFILSRKIQSLISNLPKCNFRLWGKIFCQTTEYIIIETKFDKNEVKATGDIPSITDEGLNCCTYFVCSGIDGEWNELPDASPEMISRSRNVHLYFTGNLETEIKANSHISANEGHLLRAQIARISASTHISPAEFYQLDDIETLTENPDYEPAFPLDESEISLDDWVHHKEFILSQGNTRLAEKLAKPDTGAEGDENSESERGVEELEAAPPLLRPISEDDDFDDGMSAWSARLCTGGLEASSFLIASNYWPGAFTIASNGVEKRWWNIYIGWGIKCEQRDEKLYQILPHYVTDEFETPGVEFQEAIDPTPEEEEELKAAHAEIKEEDAEESVNESEEEEESEELESGKEGNK